MKKIEGQDEDKSLRAGIIHATNSRQAEICLAHYFSVPTLRRNFDD
jgi:hypothetical protein